MHSAVQGFGINSTQYSNKMHIHFIVYVYLTHNFSYFYLLILNVGKLVSQHTPSLHTKAKHQTE